jgi:WD40 repeat protein
MSWNATLQTLEGHAYPVRSIAFSPDGKLVASGSNDGTIKLWDTTSGTLQGTLGNSYEPVISVSFSADGKLIASCRRGCTIELWETASGALQGILEGDGARVVAFSPDGKLIASGSRDCSEIPPLKLSNTPWKATQMKYWM